MENKIKNHEEVAWRGPNVGKVYPTEEVEESRFSLCPNCGRNSVRAKELGEGGGIECTTPDCHYWFCY